VVRMPQVPDGWFDADSESERRGDALVTNSQPDGARIARNERAGQQAAATKPANPIGPVKGYPEMGRDAWRAGNDDVIVVAVKKFNSEHGYFPGDAEFMTPQLMKAWMMQESGGSRHAFETDPFQVNKHGDWPATGEKTRISGLHKGQKMQPDTSAGAALNWLHYKGRINNDGKQVPYQGHYEALRKYNAAPGSTPGVPKGADYANAVLKSAWGSYVDWQK